MASHPQWYNPFRLPWYPLMGFSSIQLAILSIESMCNEAELETLCLGASRPLQNTSLVMCSRGSGWPRALSNIQRTLKGSFLSARYTLTSGTKHPQNQSRKNLIVQAFLVYNQKPGSCCLSFPFWTRELVALELKAIMIISPTASAQSSRVSPSLLP